MKGVWKNTKYQFFRIMKPITIYYLFLIIITLIAFIVNLFFSKVESQDGYITLTIYILLFIGFLSFKTNFKLMQSFNISRKRFLMGYIFACLMASFFAGFCDAMLDVLIPLVLPYTGYYQVVYHNPYFFNDLIWTFTLYLLVMTAGFLLAATYYRSNSFFKPIIILSPIYLFLIISLIVMISNLSFYTLINEINHFKLILATDSYKAVSVFVSGFLVLSFCNYLLLRRMVVKD